ncbi:hypothetical protein QTO01_17105 [Vibrio mytili]|uniref:Transcription-repair coupling factor n=1 Tax=Vibrio mytili TaxID=50718 RepID=A0A0C3IEA1_9VIBR|nr:hypothetical protein [Vibrio mytili]KIN12662.1 transcription-repair coupling factor [Vibrio mytili]
MDNPKTYILVFACLSAMLLLLLLIPPSTEKTVSATVISNTLTQSLDGQRRYLTIDAVTTGQQRVSVPISVSCSEGATATFKQATDSAIKQPLSLISCE